MAADAGTAVARSKPIAIVSLPMRLSASAAFSCEARHVLKITFLRTGSRLTKTFWPLAETKLPSVLFVPFSAVADANEHHFGSLDINAVKTQTALKCKTLVRLTAPGTSAIPPAMRL
jgi:hypothetical protein